MSLKMEDTVKNRTYPKRPFAWYVEKPSAKDYLLTVFIFAVCTLIGLLFQKLDLTDTNIVSDDFRQGKSNRWRCTRCSLQL